MRPVEEIHLVGGSHLHHSKVWKESIYRYLLIRLQSRERLTSTRRGNGRGGVVIGRLRRTTYDLYAAR